MKALMRFCVSAYVVHRTHALKIWNSFFFIFSRFRDRPTTTTTTDQNRSHNARTTNHASATDVSTMIVASDDVTLNIYELISDQQDPAAIARSASSTNSAPSTTAVSSFFSRILAPMGFGAYHTSVDVHGYCYTFGAATGIQKSLISNKSIHVPTNGIFKESITLGPCSLARGEINEVLTNIRKFFSGTSYHLVNRNCNHFTETFATALILAGRLADNKNSTSLNTYPKWVNRLAKSGTSLINHGDVCDVFLEARHAAGMEDKVGWDLPLTSTLTHKQSAMASKHKIAGKKELTQAQKAALAKLTKNQT